MKNALLLCLCLALAPTAHAVQEDELLPPDRAFSINARVLDPSIVLVEWDVADGYYMYRDKIRFESQTPSVRLGKPELPPGKIKEDEFFGRVQVYRHTARVKLPVERDSPDPVALRLTAHSQGCADLGVCYPPLKQTVLLNLPAVAAPEPQAAEPPSEDRGPVQRLKQLGDRLGLGNTQGDFLPPDEAFAFSADVQNANSITAHWKIADQYYLYRDKFRFKLKDAEGVTLGEVMLPPGKVKDDPFIGKTEVFYHAVEVPLKLVRDSSAPTEVTLEAVFQGCAEAGICYPPMTRAVALALPAAAGPAPSATAPIEPEPPARVEPTGAVQEEQPEAEQDRLARVLTEKPLWISMALFFVLGIGLAATPCVFPMIPILSGIIVGQGEHITTRKAFFLSLIYVLAMAITYTAAGVVAAMFGHNLQAAFQDPWIVGGFVAIFVVLALSMFGFYELQLPSSWQSKLTELSNRQEGGTFIGVAVMGFLSALIVGPCVAAPLAGALLIIGQAGEPVLGGAALFALSLGMGLPLLVIGTSAGKLIPKAGNWMNVIKAIFGVLLLALGIWFLERVIPYSVALALWAVLFIVSAIYMGALERVGADATGWRKLWKGIGVVLLIYGASLMIGAFTGAGDMLQPLKDLGGGGPRISTTGQPSAERKLPFRRITTEAELEEALAAARTQNKPVMLDYYADWCVECVRMEKTTFADPQVHAALSEIMLVQADVTDYNDDARALVRRFDLIGPPAILFFDTTGEELRGFRLIGYFESEEFISHVQRFLGRTKSPQQ